MLKILIFNTQEDCSVRLIIKKFVYELYDFDQGVYKSVEEAICNLLAKFPSEDPMELFGFGLN